jgi:hypothetical protein
MMRRGRLMGLYCMRQRFAVLQATLVGPQCRLAEKGERLLESDFGRCETQLNDCYRTA